MSRRMLGMARIPVRRRLLGSLIIVAGLLVVLAGFRTDLCATVDPSRQQVVTIDSRPVSIPVGDGVTAAGTAEHLLDHGLAAGGRVATLADLAFRGGVVAMVIAGVLAALTLLAGPARGFAGVAAGLGLLGDALVAAVLVGERTRLTLDRTTGLAFHVDLGAGLELLALGFALVLVGGALAALRPFAGVVGGVSLAVSGAAAGAGLALLIGGDRVV